MDLTHRPTRLNDLDACLSIIRNGFAFGPDDRAALPALWHHLIAGGMAESAVIEDRDRPAGRRVVGFGMTVFVTDQFVEEAKHGLPPYLARHVLCLWQEGRAPFLTAEQIRRANSTEGLNGLILHNGWENGGLTVDQASALRQKIIEGFFAHHSGYRLRCILHEIYGAAERDKLVVQGWHQETDYTAFSSAHSPPPLPENVPFLVSLQREKALENIFGQFYRLFNSASPRLFFRPAEQALLRGALRGEGDTEIASALRVSPFTIHKRWRAIYERVASYDPGLLPEGIGSSRGQEKRRVLLRYLQSHPEELRPVMPPPRGGRE